MAILIDIEIPQNCKECPFSDIVVVGHIYREQYICNFSGKHQSLRRQKRPDWCPMREINTDGDLISRQDAMGAVQEHFNDDGFKGYDDGQKMLDRIKALPSADRPQGDLISRQAAVEKILRNKDAKPLNKSDYQDGIRAGLDIAYCEIRDMPSVTPTERTGEWGQISPARIYECSKCGQNVMTDDIEAYKFCHGCGAKMDGGK